MKVYYLGPLGSYSSIVAENAFSGESLEPLSSFRCIIDEVLKDPDVIGILPIENSSTSNIHENIDYFFAHDIKIIGEANLQIALHLTGLEAAELSDIKTVYSHPKALLQCSRFLEENKLHVEEVASTSDGGAQVLSRQDASCAVIGSRALAKSDGLQLLAENIGNEQDNKTRFVFVSQASHEPLSETGTPKIALTFKTKHEPGSLARVLTAIADTGCNVTKIESRPIPGTDWEYLFWIDVEVTSGDTLGLLQVIEESTLEYKLCGEFFVGPTFKS